jgi:hypothetical protein
VDVAVGVGVWLGATVGVGVSVGWAVDRTVGWVARVAEVSVWETSGAAEMTHRLITTDSARMTTSVNPSERWFRNCCLWFVFLFSSLSSRNLCIIPRNLLVVRHSALCSLTLSRLRKPIWMLQ